MKQYNLITLIEDERGLEMLQLVANATHDRVLFAYTQILEYVNLNGLEETYQQYLTVKNKIKLPKQPCRSYAFESVYVHENGLEELHG